MRRCTESKTLQVLFETRCVHVQAPNIVFEHVRAVNALATRANFLATHENIKRVGIARVDRVWQCVKGTRVAWKLVENVVVGAVDALDNLAESNFSACV